MVTLQSNRRDAKWTDAYCGDAANSSIGPGQSGGAIFSREDLTVINSTITRNSAGDGGSSFPLGPSTPINGFDGGKGGGIYSSGTLSLISSTVSDNQSGNGRDGIGAYIPYGENRTGFGVMAEAAGEFTALVQSRSTAVRFLET